MSPCTGVEIGGFFAQEVHRHHAELHGGAAAEPQHRVAFRHFEEFFDKRRGLVDDSLKFLASVRHFEDRKSGIGKIDDGIRGVADGVLAQYRGAGIKIMYFHKLGFRVFFLFHKRINCHLDNDKCTKKT